MQTINQKMEKSLGLICNQFVEEHIGTAKLELMPPQDKIPIISRIHYERSTDTFGIYFDECSNYNCKTKDNIDFLEDQSGHLMAIHIREFSRLDVESIKLNVLTTIENEIQEVTMEFTARQDIINNVIDKRKLMFLNNIVKDDYKDLIKEYIK